MKTLLPLMLAILIGFSVSAQKMARIPANLADKKAPLLQNRAIDEPIVLNKAYKPYARPFSKGAPSDIIETQIGTTVYDLQTNASIQNRVYGYNDGGIAAVWTMSMLGDGAWADRGTGYNFSDGTWGAFPTVRLKTQPRTGWPSINPLGNGECVVAHNGTDLSLTKRSSRGGGAWATTTITGPAGSQPTWPRAVTNGNSIHVIVNAYTAFRGVTNAVLYLRSLDAGATWEPAKVLAGIDSAALAPKFNANFTGFGGDAYAMARPRGDTLAFVVSDGWGGMWAMKSFDNGTTWTKVTVFEMPPVVADTIYPSIDDNDAIAIDKHGKIHIAVGRMRISDSDLTTANASYYPYTDGLVYWNEDMPAMDTTLLGDLDALEAKGMLIGYTQDYNGDGVINFPEVGADQYPFALYGCSLSSMAQIQVDNEDNVFVIYSSNREDRVNTGATPNAQMYKHTYYTAKLNGVWTDVVDLNENPDHDFDDCVFASMDLANNNIHVIYQADPEPGNAVRSDADQDVYGDNYIYHLTFPTTVALQPHQKVESLKVYPNPVKNTINASLTLKENSKVKIEVFNTLGQVVMTKDLGMRSAGENFLNADLSSVKKGIYMVKVSAGKDSATQKIVKE